jgi:hypothetical protein
MTKPKQAWKNPTVTRETPGARLKVMSRSPGATLTVQTSHSVSLDAEDRAAFDEVLVRANNAAAILGLPLAVVEEGLHAVLSLVVEVCAWCPKGPNTPTGAHVSHTICPACVTTMESAG